ncbi:MAG: glucose-6-phosphate isomerase [Alphaproteobacteria bacterium]|nr:glucose-6-phosphate isomerase [Alphaproteobacteria bacterium]
MTNPQTLPVWASLQAHQKELETQSLKTLREDQARQEKLTLTLENITGDFTRMPATIQTLDLLFALAHGQNFEAMRKSMFEGEKINLSESRPVLHTALRSTQVQPLFVDGQDIMPLIRQTRMRMESFVRAVRTRQQRGFTGKPIDTIVNIGIGGSDLGPHLLCQALKDLEGVQSAQAPALFFVNNLDSAALRDVFKTCNPQTTLFLLVSKSFTTQETLVNARHAKNWLNKAMGEMAHTQHFLAVTANAQGARDFGIINPDMIFPMWDWVGGRFSLWSAASLSFALLAGWNAFATLLAGAAKMDEHFKTASLPENLPAMAALLELWVLNFWAVPAIAILPYAQRLELLPAYLQQLEMESNGKSVSRQSEPLSYSTGPIIFGSCGTSCQHSFMQWIHQSPTALLSSFIGIKHDPLALEDTHQALLKNLKAQAQALEIGTSADDPARTNPGNRPSMILWLDRLTPFTLGQLLAFYEHKVFTQSILWNINAFDQFGVELGKTLARE